MNNKMRLAAWTWPEVETYLKSKKDIIIPIGSTEQHGPTGLIGTDFMTAQAIAEKVGETLQTLVAPPICYGMANHHLAFAGSASARPSVYQSYVAEITRSFYIHGFRNFYFVNGHGGNEMSIQAVFQELKAENLEDATFKLYNWWRGKEVADLANKLYGKEEGMHATPSEVSLTFYIEKLEPRPYEKLNVTPADVPWPLSSKEIRKFFPDGVMRSNPGLARAEHGEEFFRVAVESISKAIEGSTRIV